MAPCKAHLWSLRAAQEGRQASPPPHSGLTPKRAFRGWSPLRGKKQLSNSMYQTSHPFYLKLHDISRIIAIKTNGHGYASACSVLGQKLSSNPFI